jgi:hypothetical protein
MTRSLACVALVSGVCMSAVHIVDQQGRGKQTTEEYRKCSRVASSAVFTRILFVCIECGVSNVVVHRLGSFTVPPRNGDDEQQVLSCLVGTYYISCTNTKNLELP